jgi:hypothetical protein
VLLSWIAVVIDAQFAGYDQSRGEANMILSRRHATLASIGAISGFFLTGRVGAQSANTGGPLQKTPPQLPTNSPNNPDYATPYDIMVGVWDGMARVYSRQGDYDQSFTALGSIVVYWKSKYSLLSFTEGKLDAGTQKAFIQAQKGKRIGFTPEYVLTVQGTHCYYHPNNGTVIIDGDRTHPDEYEFHLINNQTSHHIRNTHRFPSPNEWQVSGIVSDSNGNIGALVEQTFRRISSEVPADFIL